AAAPGRALPGRSARGARGRLLARDAAGPRAPEHGRRLAAALPVHARGHASDACPGRRSPTVPFPASCLRDDLELTCGYRPVQAVLSKSLFAPCGRHRTDRSCVTVGPWQDTCVLVTDRERAGCGLNPAGTARGTPGCTNSSSTRRRPARARPS